MSCVGRRKREGEAADRYTHTRVGGWGGRAKYVEMTKADAMQEASGEDETLKPARLPSDERESGLPFP